MTFGAGRIYKVEIRGCHPGDIRDVDVPLDEIAKTPQTNNDVLELVFHYGQNDIQSRPYPSVSVGDVIQVEYPPQDAGRYEVRTVGFRKLEDGS